jgi:hypothetical protein
MKRLICSGSTLDIDVVIEASDEDEMITAIRRLVEQMQINVEFASPADFIPIPSQWAAHAKYIGRYGKIDAFYFDKLQPALLRATNDQPLSVAQKRKLFPAPVPAILEYLDTLGWKWGSFDEHIETKDNLHSETRLSRR